MKKQTITPEQKQEIISRVKDKGERVADIAKEYDISANAIYGYLSKTAQGSSEILAMSK